MTIVTRVALLISLSVLPAVAAADPGKGKGNGNGKGNAHASGPVVIGVQGRGGSGRSDRDLGCPPGLAKKGNGCQPPGQARKNGGVAVAPFVRDPVVVFPAPLAIRPEPRPESPILITPAAVPVVVGQRYDNVHYVTRPGRYGLAPAVDGYRYGIVGNQLVRLDSETGIVLSVIRLVEAILD